MRRADVAGLVLAVIAMGVPAWGEDALYEALLGPALSVEADVLLSAPGYYVGRAVLTRGRLEADAKADAFELVVPSGRLPLKLEPEAAGLVVGGGGPWLGRTVEVEGLFHRETVDSASNAPSLRAWRVSPVGGASSTPATTAPALALEALVYGGGRYDGTLVRVRGTYRGANVHDDLPQATRRTREDWVLKDGYFAAWVNGHEPRATEPARGSQQDTGLAVEVVGVPSTSNGVVRIAAREVYAVLDARPAVVSRAVPTVRAATPPRVSFTYPPPGEALGPRGRMIVQFSKSMDPTRFEKGVRVRFGPDGGSPGLELEYRDRQRALVITPTTPPPPQSEVVVELLDVVVDVDGRGLEPRARREGAADVVELLRFQSGP